MANNILLYVVNRFARAMSQYERPVLTSVSLPSPRSRRSRASLSVNPWISSTNSLSCSFFWRLTLTYPKSTLSRRRSPRGRVVWCTEYGFGPYVRRTGGARRRTLGDGGGLPGHRSRCSRRRLPFRVVDWLPQGRLHRSRQCTRSGWDHPRRV